MQITYELMTMAQMPISTIDKALLTILKQRAWFVPSEMVTKDQAIENEFLVCLDELESVARDYDYPAHIRTAAGLIYNQLPDVVYLHIIDQ